MGLFEKYSFLYGDTAFTPEEQAEIGRFVAGMVKAASEGNRLELNNVYEQHFAYAKDDTLKKIGRVLYHFSKHGDQAVKVAADKHFVREALPVVEKAAELVKKAGIGDVFGAVARGVAAAGRGALSSFNPLLAGIGLLGISMPVVKAGIDALRQPGQLRSSLKAVLQQHPELRNDPNTGQYFHLLTTFAPSIAANPLMAGQMLKRFHEAGPSLFSNTETLRNLVGIEGTISQVGKPAQDQVNTMASGMMTMANILAKQEEFAHRKMEHEVGKEQFSIVQGLKALEGEKADAANKARHISELGKQHAAVMQGAAKERSQEEQDRIRKIQAMLGQAGRRP